MAETADNMGKAARTAPQKADPWGCFGTGVSKASEGGSQWRGASPSSPPQMEGLGACILRSSEPGEDLFEAAEEALAGLL